MATVVHLDDGKRYSVFLQQRADGTLRVGRVSVWMPGAYNRAGHWRGIDRYGPRGNAAAEAAIAAYEAKGDIVLDEGD